MSTHENAASIASSRPVAILGAGTLGRRIALMFATGSDVRVCDRDVKQHETARSFINQSLPAVLDQVESDSPGEVTFSDDLAETVTGAWLVIESLPELLEVKIPVFGQLDAIADADAILATNSSSHPSSRMIGEVTHTERVVNMHFFMPPVANAVEIMSCGHTDESVFTRLLEALPRFGLTPFRVHAQSMGFIHNRIWAAIKREALMVLDEGVASPAEIDAIYKLVLGARSGPFRSMDRVGLDVVLDIEENYAASRDGIPESPRRLLREYLAQGRLGMKSGRGFYDDYDQPAGS